MAGWRLRYAVIGASGAPSVTTYGYDPLSRLTSVSAPSGDTTYSYDPVGNRLGRTRGGTTTTSTYDRADRFQSAGGVSYSQDAAGNLVGRGADTFTYDQANRLASAVVGGTTTSYSDTGDGRRASSTSGTVTTTATYDTATALPVMLFDGTRKYVWGAQGLAYSVNGSAVKVVHADGLGSVRRLTDASGTTLATYATDEFGIPTTTLGASDQPYGYTGERRQATTGLVYLPSRDYDPARRWRSVSVAQCRQRPPWCMLAGGQCRPRRTGERRCSMAQRLGQGSHVYEVDERWGQLPVGWTLVDVVGVVVDGNDRVYAFTRGNHPIVIFERDGRLVGSWGEGKFANPHGLQIGPDGSLYTVDNGDHTVRKWSPDGQLLLTLGTPGKASDTGYAGSLDTLKPGGPFNRPTNCAVAPDGSLYVTDGYGNCRVHHFAADGALLHSWGEPGGGPGQFRLVHGICVTPDGTVYVGDRANDRVQVFDASGRYLREWADVRQPDEIHLGPDGAFYVAELGWANERPGRTGIGGRVTVRDATGTILSAWGDGDPDDAGNFVAPHGVRVDSRGDLYLGEVTYTSKISQKLAKPSCRCFQKFIRIK